MKFEKLVLRGQREIFSLSKTSSDNSNLMLEKVISCWVVFVHRIVVNQSDIAKYVYMYFLIKDHIIACMSQQNIPSSLLKHQ